MHPDLLNTFTEISGLPKILILVAARRLPLDGEVLLHFYMHYGRFPTYNQGLFIHDTGLPNFNFLHSFGIIVP